MTIFPCELVKPVWRLEQSPIPIGSVKSTVGPWLKPMSGVGQGS